MLKLSFALCPLLALSAVAQEKSASNDAPANATESSAATSAQLPVLQLQPKAVLKKPTEGSSRLCSIPLLESPFLLEPASPLSKRHRI